MKWTLLISLFTVLSHSTCIGTLERIANTQKWYEDPKNVERYFEMFSKWKPDFLEESYELFESYLPANARIMDVAVGTGRDFKYFIDKGYIVDGNELSSTMAAKAVAELDIPNLSFFGHYFHELGGQKHLRRKFDGLWAYSALVNVHHSDLESNLASLLKLLKKDGVLFFNVQAGAKGTREFKREDESVARLFTTLHEGDLEQLLDIIEQNYGIKTSIEFSEVRLTEGDMPDWIDFMVKRLN